MQKCIKSWIFRVLGFEYVIYMAEFLNSSIFDLLEDTIGCIGLFAAADFRYGHDMATGTTSHKRCGVNFVGNRNLNYRLYQNGPLSTIKYYNLYNIVD